jgi:hypothetical protein
LVRDQSFVASGSQVVDELDLWGSVNAPEVKGFKALTLCHSALLDILYSSDHELVKAFFICPRNAEA